MISTDTPRKIDRTVYVYYNPKPTIKVCLKFHKEEVESLTLSELIARVIKTLNEDYLLPINMSKSAYCVFPASKTGMKRDGYPELDSKLPITKINMRRFFLEEVSKTFSLISTEFNLERKYGLEKRAGNEIGCCQIFKLLKA